MSDVRIDARLIAAAPDLLEAAEEYMAHVKRFHGESGFPGNRCEWCEQREAQITAAIAKARGEDE